MTTYEREIYHIITSSARHLTVEQIYAEIKRKYPQIVMATVYNNVNKLWKAGLIHKVSVEGMPDRYDRAVKHDHLVCRRCGSLADVSLEDLTASLRRQLGEDFLSYDLKVFYLCPACREREKGQEQRGQEKTEQGWTGQDQTEQDQMEQGRIGQEQGQAEQDQMEQDQT